MANVMLLLAKLMKGVGMTFLYETEGSISIIMILFDATTGL